MSSVFIVGKRISGDKVSRIVEAMSELYRSGIINDKVLDQFRMGSNLLSADALKLLLSKGIDMRDGQTRLVVANLTVRKDKNSGDVTLILPHREDGYAPPDFQEYVLDCTRRNGAQENRFKFPCLISG